MMKPLIVANWKMNPPTFEEARELFNSVKKGLGNIKAKKAEIIICPPFVYLLNLKSEILNPVRGSKAGEKKYAQQTSNGVNLKLGAQNCFWQEKGAFTGEISPKMLKDLGCQYVILGHSERRRYFGETDEDINRKIKAAITAKLSPILCVGESRKEREEGKTKKVLEIQLRTALENISKFSILNTKFSIAYEPIWAIGTGKSCPSQEVQIMSLLLRKVLFQKYGPSISDRVRILYGGSVNSQNAVSYIKEAKSQGFLVGGASLNAQEFLTIIRQANSLLSKTYS